MPASLQIQDSRAGDFWDVKAPPGLVFAVFFARPEQRTSSRRSRGHVWVNRLNIGDENAHREKSRDDRVAVRWHFAGVGPKRAANGRATASSRWRGGQPRQSGTSRTGRHAGRSGTGCAIRGAKPVSALGRAADSGDDNPRCASSETPQAHVHVGNGHASSQASENGATGPQTADQTMTSF
jgi:hypothetical protein